MGKQDWKKIYAIKKQKEDEILSLYPTLNHNSGIYTFHRVNELGFRFYYSGQAKSVLNRIVSHLTNYKPIDNSIRNHGLYNEDTNPYGWKLDYYYCDKDKLDEEETKTVAYWHIEKGYAPYNVTRGGQGVGKIDIGVRKQPKTYTQGKVVGYQTARKDVKKLFDKYLTYDIKGTPNITKEKAKEKFRQFLEVEEE